VKDIHQAIPLTLADYFDSSKDEEILTVIVILVKPIGLREVIYYEINAVVDRAVS
jgi:hypothetical protein